MQLEWIDWVVVAVYGVVTLLIGLIFTRRAGRSLEQYFLSGRKLPWWLLGTSMVATTFSTDTPNLVTDLVRTGGVSMNWLWWAFLITGMLTVFFYAKLWRRSGALTDINFYELRYSGAPAAFLRGFRAIYLGVFFNVMIMATVTLAAIKISGVLLGLDPYATVVIAALITVIYAATSGLWGVVTTDFLLFALAMVGCNIREIHWGWPLAIVSSLLYFVLFWRSKLYGDATLQLFFAGIARVAAHQAAVVQHLEYVLTILTAVLVLGERPGRKGVAGLVLVGVFVSAFTPNRPVMYGIVPPPCDQMNRMSGNFDAVPLYSTLAIVIVVSVLSVMPRARPFGSRLTQHSDLNGCV